ncbi:MAG: hypothetical protein HN366_18665 [Deltaproteobacteria bacterium]|nr:hypothetical protein [Deltaproteobacteria bacterium]
MKAKEIDVGRIAEKVSDTMGMAPEALYNKVSGGYGAKTNQVNYRSVYYKALRVLSIDLCLTRIPNFRIAFLQNSDFLSAYQWSCQGTIFVHAHFQQLIWYL